jgi:hypothetical protein
MDEMLEMRREGRDVRAADAERSLDPASDAEWAELRELGHRMVDKMFDHIRGLRSTPAWQKPPEQTKAKFASDSIPRQGVGAEVAYESFLHDVLPYGIGNSHPRFWGWVMGGGTAVGMLAEMLARGNESERADLMIQQRWWRSRCPMADGADGYAGGNERSADERRLDGQPAGAGGGRSARAGFNVREEGTRWWSDVAGVLLDETHSWLKKAVELMGMGQACLCPVVWIPNTG